MTCLENGFEFLSDFIVIVVCQNSPYLHFISSQAFLFSYCNFSTSHFLPGATLYLSTIALILHNLSKIADRRSKAQFLKAILTGERF